MTYKTYYVSAEQRQYQDAKRRKVERPGGDDAGDMKIATPSAKLELTASGHYIAIVSSQTCK
jgi:hypothetical protein